MICPSYTNPKVKSKFNNIVEGLGGQPLSNEEFKNTDLRNERTGDNYKAMNLAYLAWDMYKGNADNIPDSIEQVKQDLINAYDEESQQQAAPTEELNQNELRKRFNLLNKDGNPKRFPKTDKNYKNILDKVANINQSQDEYRTSVTEIMGEKGDNRTYYNVKFERNRADIQRRNVQDPQIKDKYFENSDVTNSSDILKSISESNHPLNKIASALLDYTQINDVNVELLNQSSIENNNIKSAGIYSRNSNKIQVARYANFRGKGSEPTLIHEILHALTYDKLREDNVVRDNMQEMYDYVLTQLDRGDHYALTDLDEFTVGLFTDGNFIKDLMNVKAKDSNKYKNVLEEVFDYILSLFGINKTDSVYPQAFSLATQLLQDEKDRLDFETAHEESIEDLVTPINEEGFLQRKSNKLPIQNAELFPILNKLSNKLGVNYQVDENMSNLGEFRNGVVYINPNKAHGDTPFHEFGHILISSIKERNSELYNNLRQQVEEGEGYSELQRTKDLYSDKSYEDQVEESIVSLLGQFSYDKYSKNPNNILLKWLNQAWAWIKKKFKQAINNHNVDATQLDPNTSLSKLAQFMTSNQMIFVDGYRVDKRFESRAEGQNEATKRQQIENLNISDQQKYNIRSIYDKLTTVHDIGHLSEDGNHYIVDKNDKQLNRVSDVINSEFPEDSFALDDRQEFEKARERGNQIDDIVELVVDNPEGIDISNLNENTVNKIREFLQKKSSERNAEDILFDNDGIKSTVNSIKNFISQFENEGIILTQRQLFNSEKQVGGTTDLILIRKDGSIDILDTKSSRQPFNKAFKKIDRDNHSEIIESDEENYNDYPDAVVRSYENSFYMAEDPTQLQNRINEINNELNSDISDVRRQVLEPQLKALEERKEVALKDKENGTKSHLVPSKKEKHRRQLELYKKLANSKGLKVNSLSVVGVQFDRMSNNKVTNIKDVSVNTIESTKELSDTFDKYKVDKEDNFEPYIDEFDEQYSKWLNDAMDLLHQQIFNLRKETAEDTVHQRQSLNRLLSDLKTLDEAKAFSKFATQVNETVNSYFKKIREIYDKIKTENLNETDYQFLLSELAYIHREIMPYKNYLQGGDGFDGLQSDLAQFGLSNIQKNSPQDKINNASTTVSNIISLYDSVAKEIFPKVLSQYSNEEMNKRISDYKKKQLDKFNAKLNNLREKLEQAKRNDNTERQSKLVNQIESWKRRKNKFKGQFFEISEEDFQKIFRGEDIFDISFIDMLFNSHGSNPNPIISALSIMMRDEYSNADLRARDKAKKLAEIYQRFKENSKRNEDNVEKFNEGLYERVSTIDYGAVDFTRLDQPLDELKRNDRMMFVQDIDMNKFNNDFLNALERARVEANSKFKKNQDKQKVNHVRNKMIDFHKNSLTYIAGLKDTIENQRKNSNYIEDFYHWVADRFYDNTFFKEYRGDPNVDKAKYGKRLYEQKIKGKSEEQINESLSYLKGLNNDLLQVDRSKYLNEKYDNIQNDPTMKEYYDTLINTYFELQQQLPPHAKKGYELPAVVKTGYDRFAEQGFRGYVKYKAKDMIESQEEDIEESGSAVTQDVKQIPINHTQKMNADDISLDIFSSLVRFIHSTETYKANAKLKDKSDTLLNTVKNLNIQEKDPKTLSSIKRSFFERSGDKKVPPNNLIRAIEDLVDNNVYGQTKVPEWIGNKRLDKILDTAKSYTSITSIGGDILVGGGNWIMARTMNLQEAIANEHFSRKDRQKAQKVYAKYISEGGFMKDYKKPFAETFVGQLAEKYDAVQGDFKDEFGNRVTGSVAKKMRSMSTWFALMSNGEFQAQTEALMSHLSANNAINEETGEEKSILDLYLEEFENSGEIALPKGWQFKNKASEDNTIDLAVRNKAHTLNQRLHGIYNNFSRPMIEKYSIGRLITMFRRFLGPAIKRRGKAATPDYEQGVITEGFYRTFLRLMYEDFRKFAGMLETDDKQGRYNIFSKDKDHLEPWERANLARATTELGTMIMLSTLMWGLSKIFEGSDDDDEEPNKMYYYTMYYMQRLKTELAMYHNPMAALKVFQTPTAMYSPAIKGARFIGQAMEDILTLSPEKYERDYGPADKGDWKSFWYLAKFAGRDGGNTHPEQALQILKQFD